MINSDGYVKYKLHGSKFYRASTKAFGRIRYSAKTFKRARDANDYSRQLVARYKRLKAAELPSEPVIA